LRLVPRFSPRPSQGVMTDTASRIGDLLPAVAAALQVERTVHRPIRIDTGKYAVLENNLGRKGIWAPDGGRGLRPAEPHQEVFVFETDDIVGHLIMESSLGKLTVFEMEVVSWVQAKWVATEEPDSPTVQFYLAELAREFGVKWGGSRAAFLKDALRKLDRV